MIDLPELSNMDGLSAEERFAIYEEKILQFRDQVIQVFNFDNIESLNHQFFKLYP